MCGIAGIFELRADCVPDEDLVADMTDLLAHRGPDDAGLLVDPPVALGHRRLSILDLSPGGHQPMASRDGRLWVVFNGEIYNYKELGEELRALGHRFHTTCDTEVLLAAYEQWGAASLGRLNGMFAFAIWDRSRRELFCARDRFGVKPFYYVEANGSFRFASEIKALLLDPAVRREPNDARVLDFLAWGYTDHTAETLFSGIHQLPPGAFMRVGPSGAGGPETWYTPHPGALNGRPAAEALREELTDAVALRLRSDVPVGTTLSGGLDSTSVTALATMLRGRDGIEPAPTFSARCTDERLDEGRYIDAVLGMTGAPNRAFTPRERDLLEHLDHVLWHMDEPFHSAAVYAHWSLSALARSGGVTVLLDGQGGDEALAGYAYLLYPGYFYTQLRSGRLRRAMLEARRRQSLQGVPVAQSAKELVKVMLPDRLRAPAIAPWIEVGDAAPAPPLPGPSLVDHHLYGLRVQPLPMYNHQLDRNTMSVALEARNPFLDYRVVEHGLALRPDEHVLEGFTKSTLRGAMRDVLPPEVLNRPQKQGFTTDESEWMRGHLGETMEETFRSRPTRSRSYFEPERVLQRLQRHREGGEHAPELWRAFIVERWLRLFVDPPRLVAPPPSEHSPRSSRSARDAVVRLDANASQALV